MMEFESMLVKLLKKDSEARNRRLSQFILKGSWFAHDERIADAQICTQIFVATL